MTEFEQVEVIDFSSDLGSCDTTSRGKDSQHHKNRSWTSDLPTPTKKPSQAPGQTEGCVVEQLNIFSPRDLIISPRVDGKAGSGSPRPKSPSYLDGPKQSEWHVGSTKEDSANLTEGSQFETPIMPLGDVDFKSPRPNRNGGGGWAGKSMEAKSKAQDPRSDSVASETQVEQLDMMEIDDCKDENHGSSKGNHHGNSKPRKPFKTNFSQWRGK